MAAWFFIRSFGPRNGYTMPWEECHELTQFVKQCRGEFQRWQDYDPGQWVCDLARNYPRLFTVDPDTGRDTWAPFPHDHIGVRAEWPQAFQNNMRFS